MDFEDIVIKRFATKKFDGRKISASDLERLKECIRMSASSFGLQPWKVKVIADAKTKESLSAATWNQPQVTSCSHLLVFCADTDIKKHIDEYEKMMR